MADCSRKAVVTMDDELKLEEKIYMDLEALGYEVYAQQKSDVLKKTFHFSSVKKPDLLVFHKSVCKEVSSPFGIECKIGDSFGKHIGQPVLQMEKYKNEEYWIDNRENKVTPSTMLLTTFPAIGMEDKHPDIIYEGSRHWEKTKNELVKYGIEWAIVRELYSLGRPKNYFGLLKKDNISYYIKFDRNYYRLCCGGILERHVNPDFKLGGKND